MLFWVFAGWLLAQVEEPHQKLNKILWDIFFFYQLITNPAPQVKSRYLMDSIYSSEISEMDPIMTNGNAIYFPILY